MITIKTILLEVKSIIESAHSTIIVYLSVAPKLKDFGATRLLYITPAMLKKNTSLSALGARIESISFTITHIEKVRNDQEYYNLLDNIEAINSTLSTNQSLVGYWTDMTVVDISFDISDFLEKIDDDEGYKQMISSGQHSYLGAVFNIEMTKGRVS